jgi:predicted nucleic acid-binding Zn ribbon protein
MDQFSPFGPKKKNCSFKSRQIALNEHRRRKKREKKIFFDVKALTTVPTHNIKQFKNFKSQRKRWITSIT